MTAHVADTITLQANVNTLTGLAQVVTGGAVLILLTWWVRNLRRGRRVRRGRRDERSSGQRRVGARDRQKLSSARLALSDS